MKKKYKSEAFHAIHEDAVADFMVGAISEERMRYYDRECLVSESTLSLSATHAAKLSSLRPAPTLASQH